jgi:hypothetical protein
MINPQFPDEAPAQINARTLRQFAALCLCIFGLLCALSIYKHGGSLTKGAWFAAAIALLIGLPGLVWPAYIKPFFMGIMAVTQPIGHVMSILLLGIVYYCFLTPLAVVFRLTGRDVLWRRRPQTTTYWTPRMQPPDPARYLRQYQSQQLEKVEPKEKNYHGASELNPR